MTAPIVLEISSYTVHVASGQQTFWVSHLCSVGILVVTPRMDPLLANGIVNSLSPVDVWCIGAAAKGLSWAVVLHALS
jgi:hypothetical protein